MAFERITQKDWYKILGAKPSDSPAELKRKYQRLALLYHPDKQKADVPAGEVEERVQRFIEIDQAWKILGNEESKKEYDLQQREDNLTKEWPLHAQIYLEEMSWNEGMNWLNRRARALCQSLSSVLPAPSVAGLHSRPADMVQLSHLGSDCVEEKAV
ncbi:dnaJ homolog subfamily C member 24 isoform X1 [Nyctibius grandis]|uniref:dnaJ homolog subfamily C member 24 isoform X1 n=1 Tax=Nyctibius grandis TaxID=48427 RepID=UPI0035BC550A